MHRNNGILLFNILKLFNTNKTSYEIAHKIDLFFLFNAELRPSNFTFSCIPTSNVDAIDQRSRKVVWWTCSWLSSPAPPTHTQGYKSLHSIKLSNWLSRVQILHFTIPTTHQHTPMVINLFTVIKLSNWLSRVQILHFNSNQSNYLTEFYNLGPEVPTLNIASSNPGM